MFKSLAKINQPKTYHINGYKIIIWLDRSVYFSGGKPNFMFQVCKGQRQIAFQGRFQTALQAFNASMLFVI